MKSRGVGVVTLLAVLAGCPSETPIGAKSVRRLKVQTAETQPEWVIRDLAGRVVSGESIQLSFRVGGQIERLSVRAGEAVEAGQVLATLDPKDLSVHRDRANAGLKGAQAALEEARAHRQRQEQLYVNEAISRADLDRARAAFEAAVSRHEQAQAEVRLASRNQGFAKLVAPAAGRVARRLVEAHQSVGAGDPVLVLERAGALEVELGVPDQLIDSVEIGAQVGIRIVPLDVNVAGTVVSVGVAPNVGGTYSIRAVPDDPVPHLRGGMAAEAKMKFRRWGVENIMLPLSAVVRAYELDAYVFVFDPKTSRVAKRPVTTGLIRRAQVVILDGLEGGEQVAVAGVSYLEDGLEVRATTSGRP